MFDPTNTAQAPGCDACVCSSAGVYHDLENADSESLHAARGSAARLGSGQSSGLSVVPPESTKIIDELIYKRLSPSDRLAVDQLRQQQACAIPIGTLTVPNSLQLQFSLDLHLNCCCTKSCVEDGKNSD
jgi:hypothetical protein